MTISKLQYDVARAPDPERLAIDMIRCDGGTQMRVALNAEAVDAYAERMDAGDVFPPVTVFYDGAAHWLADGFHRVAAQRKVAVGYAGSPASDRWSRITVTMRAGTRADAIRFAISANRSNGLRRTNADKQIAVLAALAHPDMQGMSDRAIADEAGVSRRMVLDHRQGGNLPPCTQPTAATHKAVNTATDRRTGTDGKSYPAPKPKKKQAKQSGSTRPAKQRDADQPAVPAKSTPRQTCPNCNGKGYIE